VFVPHPSKLRRLTLAAALALVALLAMAAHASASVDLEKVGDVNGDGRPDYSIVVIAPGTIYDGAWVLFGTAAPQSYQIPPAPGAGFQVKRAGTNPLLHSLTNIGDFDGDGKDDLLLLADKPYVIYGQASSNTVTAGTSPQTTTLVNGITGTSAGDAIGIGDFNGDHRPDLVVLRTRPPLWLWSSRVSAAVVDGGPRVPSIDVRNDVSTGATRVMSINGSVVCHIVCGESINMPRPVGDINGDGKTDLANYVTTGYVILGRASNATITVGHPDAASILLNITPYLLYGNPIGDVTGDGIDDLAYWDYSGTTPALRAIPGVHTAGGITLSTANSVPVPAVPGS
jgi:hypothetical protein